MKKSLYSIALCALSFSSLSAIQTAAPVEQVNSDIRFQIQQLEAERRILVSRKGFALREADRVMFQDWLSYRSHMARAERYDSEIKIIDAKIAALKAKLKTP